MLLVCEFPLPIMKCDRQHLVVGSGSCGSLEAGPQIGSLDWKWKQALCMAQGMKHLLCATSFTGGSVMPPVNVESIIWDEKSFG